MKAIKTMNAIKTIKSYQNYEKAIKTMNSYQKQENSIYFY